MSGKNGELAPLAYSVPDTCRVLGVSRQTAYNLINSGSLRSFTEGRRRFVSAKALEDYIAAREAEEARKGVAA